MPRFLPPQKSTPHRVAAIALYRALLLQCSSAPLPDEHRTSLHNAIRQKFRKNRKLASPYQLGLAFRAGYETLDHLDNAHTGNESSTNFLINFVDTLPCGLKRPPPIRRPPPPPPPQDPFPCLPPERAVLNVRPYAKVSGPRHVPVLANANGIPFLRLTKPQPPALSKIIHQKLKRTMRRFDTRVLLENYDTPLAMQEDDWDEILARNLGVTGESESESKTETGEPGEEDDVLWIEAVDMALEESIRQNNEEIEGYKRTRAKMMKIVEQETALALKEGRKIVRGKDWKQSTKRVAR